jgi:hypothetical protein
MHEPVFNVGDFRVRHELELAQMMLVYIDLTTRVRHFLSHLDRDQT